MRVRTRIGRLRALREGGFLRGGVFLPFISLVQSRSRARGSGGEGRGGAAGLDWAVADKGCVGGVWTGLYIYIRALIHARGKIGARLMVESVPVLVLLLLLGIGEGASSQRTLLEILPLEYLLDQGSYYKSVVKSDGLLGLPAEAHELLVWVMDIAGGLLFLDCWYYIDAWQALIDRPIFFACHYVAIRLLHRQVSI